MEKITEGGVEPEKCEFKRASDFLLEHERGQVIEQKDGKAGLR